MLGEEGGSRVETRRGCAVAMITAGRQLPNARCPWQHLLRAPPRWPEWMKTAVAVPAAAAGRCAGLGSASRRCAKLPGPDSDGWASTRCASKQAQGARSPQPLPLPPPALAPSVRPPPQCPLQAAFQSLHLGDTQVSQMPAWMPRRKPASAVRARQKLDLRVLATG